MKHYKSLTIDEALQEFMEILWHSLCKFIPYEEIRFEKTSHPWLNSKCRKAIEAKNEMEGSEKYAEARHQCSQILTSEYQKYVAQLKEKINSLPKGSKQW